MFQLDLQPQWAVTLMSAYYPLLMTCASLIVCMWAEVSGQQEESSGTHYWMRSRGPWGRQYLIVCFLNIFSASTVRLFTVGELFPRLPANISKSTFFCF